MIQKQTSSQRHLIRFLDFLVHELDLNPVDALNRSKFEDPRRPMDRLRRIRDYLIRAHVITAFADIESTVNHELAKSVLRRRVWWPPRAKRPKVLGEIFERMPIESKLRILKTLRHVPNEVNQIILAMNTVRNGLAHRDTLEDRRKPVKYRGNRIVDRNGFEQFRADETKLLEFFFVIPAMKAQREQRSTKHNANKVA